MKLQFHQLNVLHTQIILRVQVYVQAVVTDWTMTDSWRHDDSVNNRCSLQ